MKIGGVSGPIGLSVAVFLALELLTWWPKAMLWLWPAWVIIFGLGGFYVSRDQGESAGRWLVLIWLSLPATGALALLLPSNGFIHVYFMVIAGLFGWWLKMGARVQRIPIVNDTVTQFLLLLDVGLVLSWEFVLSGPDMLAMSLIWIIAAALSWQAWSGTGNSSGLALVTSLSMALVLTELSWLLLYWPIHWLAAAGIIATAYYVCFHLVSRSFKGSIGWGIATEYGLVGTLAVSIILWINQWT
jgi:hypothetical protein